MASVSTDTAFFGHPRGLSTLFFTEMWERFSYYGMRALLILFMVAPVTSGGLGLDTVRAGAIYGLYTAMVYMTTLPGGWVADHLIGAQRAVLYGGILIAAGHFSMAVPTLTTFYAGLALIVIGTGLLKGNVSVIVGRLYTETDPRRDAAYSIFYMGINIGSFLAPLVCGYLGQRVSWHSGFAAAGVGMTFGLAQYMLGRRHLGEAGLYPAASSVATSTRDRRHMAWAVAAVVGLTVVLALAHAAGVLTLTATVIADAAGYFLLAITVGFFAWLYIISTGWTASERKRLYVIGLLFLGAALFWSEFEQAGSTLNLFADRNTSNIIAGWEFPSAWYQSANALFIIMFAPVFAWLWVRLARKGIEPTSTAKFGAGLVLVGAGFATLIVPALIADGGVRVSPGWLMLTYLLHTWGELLLSPVGLSAMSKLAPARIGGLVMGVWFLAAACGNYIGGRMAAFYEAIPIWTLFAAVAAFGVATGMIFLLLARPIGGLERNPDAA
ncbi:MAG: peptide MFS transporter [Vicinamibacterales bacterium]